MHFSLALNKGLNLKTLSVSGCRCHHCYFSQTFISLLEHFLWRSIVVNTHFHDLRRPNHHPCVVHCLCLLSLCITCQDLCTYSEKVLAAAPWLCLFWREARCVRRAVCWRHKPLPQARRDPLPTPPTDPQPTLNPLLLDLCFQSSTWP